MKKMQRTNVTQMNESGRVRMAKRRARWGRGTGFDRMGWGGGRYREAGEPTLRHQQPSGYRESDVRQSSPRKSVFPSRRSRRRTPFLPAAPSGVGGRRRSISRTRA